MSTLPPPKVKPANPESIEKQVYSILEKFESNIPVAGDRYRMAYNIYKYVMGEGDAPEILVKSAKIELVDLTQNELAASLNEELQRIIK